MCRYLPRSGTYVCHTPDIVCIHVSSVVSPIFVIFINTSFRMIIRCYNTVFIDNSKFICCFAVLHGCTILSDIRNMVCSVNPVGKCHGMGSVSFCTILLTMLCSVSFQCKFVETFCPCEAYVRCCMPLPSSSRISVMIACTFSCHSFFPPCNVEKSKDRRRQNWRVL